MNWKVQASVYLLLVAMCLCAVYAQGVISVDVLSSTLAAKRTPRAPFEIADLSDRIVSVRREAASAGIAAGDRLLSVDGVPYAGLWTLGRALRGRPPGEWISVMVGKAGSAGATVDRRVRLEARSRYPDIREAVEAWCYWLPFPFYCLLLAIILVVLRPLRLEAWTGLLILISLGQMHPWPFLRMVTEEGEFALWFHQLAHYGIPLWLLVFIWLFPVQFPFLRNRKWLAVAMAAVVAWFALLRAVMEVGTYVDLMLAQTAAQLLFGPPGWFPGVGMMAVLLGAFFVVRKAVPLRHTGAASKIVVLLLAVVVSFGPLALYSAVDGLLRWFGDPGLPPLLLAPALFCLYLLPPGLVWAVVAEQFPPFRSTARASLNGLFSPVAVFCVRAVLALVVVTQVLLIIVDPNTWPWRAVILGMCLVATVVAPQVSEWLADAVDERFFHDIRRAERVLFREREELRKVRTAEGQATAVARAMARAFDTRLALVLMENEGAVHLPEAVIGRDPGSGFHFRSKSGPVESLSQTGRPLVLDRTVHVNGHAPAEDRSTEDWRRLEAADVRLLVPLTVDRRMPGFVALGEKNNGKAYSEDEVNVAAAFCQDVAGGLALLVSTERAAEHRGVRQRLQREQDETNAALGDLAPAPGAAGRLYEIRTLFQPADPPRGDFCHFQRWPDQRICFFLGNGTGGGVEALRRAAEWKQALWEALSSPELDLAARLAAIDSNWAFANPAGRIRWMCIELDPSSGRLQVLNRGLPPPCVFRHTAEGAVLLRPTAPGDELLTLGEGDVLLAYTDGATNAGEGTGNLWGEAALLERFLAEATRPVAEVLPLLYKSLTFAGGDRPQPDDITLVGLARYAERYEKAES